VWLSSVSVLRVRAGSVNTTMKCIRGSEREIDCGTMPMCMEIQSMGGEGGGNRMLGGGVPEGLHCQIQSVDHCFEALQGWG
jgi:hypothetical protein